MIKDMFFYFIPIIYVILRILVYTCKKKPNELRETIFALYINGMSTIFVIFQASAFVSMICDGHKLQESIQIIFVIPITMFIPGFLALAKFLAEVICLWALRKDSKKDECCYECCSIEYVNDLSAFELYNYQNS